MLLFELLLLELAVRPRLALAGSSSCFLLFLFSCEIYSFFLLSAYAVHQQLSWDCEGGSPGELPKKLASTYCRSVDRW